MLKAPPLNPRTYIFWVLYVQKLLTAIIIDDDFEEEKATQKSKDEHLEPAQNKDGLSQEETLAQAQLIRHGLHVYIVFSFNSFIISPL